MARVIIPVPSRDFDPSEAAISWQVLTQLGHRVSFATPDGLPGQCDPLMISGEGLDVWGQVPLLRRLRLVGLILRANADARRAYAAMLKDAAYNSSLRWDRIEVDNFDGILLPGGHRVRGMREYLESESLQRVTAGFFAAS